MHAGQRVVQRDDLHRLHRARDLVDEPEQAVTRTEGVEVFVFRADRPVAALWVHVAEAEDHADREPAAAPERSVFETATRDTAERRVADFGCERQLHAALGEEPMDVEKLIAPANDDAAICGLSEVTEVLERNGCAAPQRCEAAVRVRRADCEHR